MRTVHVICGVYTNCNQLKMLHHVSANINNLSVVGNWLSTGLYERTRTCRLVLTVKRVNTNVCFHKLLTFVFAIFAKRFVVPILFSGVLNVFYFLLYTAKLFFDNLIIRFKWSLYLVRHSNIFSSVDIIIHFFIYF